MYNHASGYWVHPRRWVRYAGTPEDFGLAAAVALPALVLTSGLLKGVLIVTVLLSGQFAAVRRRLTGVPTWLFGEGPAGE